MQRNICLILKIDIDQMTRLFLKFYQIVSRYKTKTGFYKYFFHRIKFADFLHKTIHKIICMVNKNVLLLGKNDQPGAETHFNCLA